MPGQPYVARLSDGRYFAVELPENSAEQDPLTGELILQPTAIHLLDKLQVLLSPLPPTTTTGRLKILRETLGLAPEELALQMGIDPTLVSEWESGGVKPTPDQMASFEAIRNRAVHAGVLIPHLARAS